jgi:AraC-like DNA-binding protein
MDHAFQDLELAKKILEDPEKADKTILDVAFDAGFFEIKKINVELRKDTGMCPVEYRAFHTQFKKITGMSPHDYRHNGQNGNSNSNGEHPA